MKYYEMLCVLPGTMTEEEVKSDVDLVSQSVAKYEASDVTIEDMGKSRLAYPIKHIRYGYFQLYRFNLEEENITKLEKELRLMDKMLRITVSVCDPSNTVSYKLALDPTAPSAPPKADKEDRPRTNRTNRTEEKKEEKTSDEVKETVEEKKEEVKEEVVVEKTVEKPVEEKSEKTKMSVEDIDKKLDEILQDDIDKV
ncbi:MAG: 30S ribosomal protein S6 [Candidatus Magasanikbacteria bacterium CG_4_10_14_0_2_um_filter_33_14]|uniref:Small ribosomal subunit protein bS6 n=1 Tax=Candidatus Magasanikbacteria bacterium CG_4_10_14_0_2_um_filter_33_14 TaxID=1974636 RepID=A0A2M7VAH5_9BACT|nr:MAG: 30S ribosomal protein S6 [Candidatus Magasanikbacteria bacterium CG_4_10_14_0_2_um_filter_33_14]